MISRRRRMREKITRPIAAGNITAPELSLPRFRVKPKHGVKREHAVTREREVPWHLLRPRAAASNHSQRVVR
jgi:hypothetical protein